MLDLTHSSTFLFPYLFVYYSVYNFLLISFPLLLFSSHYYILFLYFVFCISPRVLYFAGAPNGVQSFEFFASGEWRTDFDAIYQKLIQSATFAEIVAGV